MARRLSVMRISFPSIGWKKVRGGGAVGRVKRKALGDSWQARVLEISPEWNEREWCRKAHTGYVLSGRLWLELEDGGTMRVAKGEGFWVPEGSAHKAGCKSVTRLFIVDRQGSSRRAAKPFSDRE